MSVYERESVCKLIHILELWYLTTGSHGLLKLESYVKEFSTIITVEKTCFFT